jgi:neurofibromin 1
MTLLCRFVGQLLRLLVCNNEKFGAQIQKHVKELVGHEMSPALYPILFDQIKAIVEKFFDQQGQVYLCTNYVPLHINPYCRVLVQFLRTD